MRHPHEGRLAEVYFLTRDGKLVWSCYTAGPDYADHPKGLVWDDTLKAWVKKLKR